MKLITRNTDYAIRALCSMAACGDKKIFSVSDLTKELGIPRPFLRKILQSLNKKGILKSYKGTGGGFLLALAADEIFLVDLIEVFQGPFKLNECILKKRFCSDIRTCMLRKKIESIEKYVVSELNSVTIASLLS
jgi:Rrf2 family protein